MKWKEENPKINQLSKKKHNDINTVYKFQNLEKKVNDYSLAYKEKYKVFQRNGIKILTPKQFFQGNQ